MNDFPESRAETLHSDVDGRQTLHLVSDSLHGARFRIEKTSGLTLTARAGSRIAYRMLGAALQSTRYRLPMRVSVHVTEAEKGSTVTIELTSDEGRYLFSTGWATAAYQREYDDLIAVISSALTRSSSAEQ